MSLSAIRIMVGGEREGILNRVQRPPKLKSHRFSRSHGFVSTDFKWNRTMCEKLFKINDVIKAEAGRLYQG